VRLSRTPTGWRITAVHPSTSGEPATTHSAAARRVLASHRIVLPPAGRADVLSGQAHDSVLQAMLVMSASYRIHVSVVRSGHPIYVFGTDRLSDHPQGRAFDTWGIDGRAVVDPRTPQWFSDATHHDHVHAGFTT
jgi:hypothetical protein